MPQFPGDFELSAEHDADSCELDYRQLFDELKASERENARLRMRVIELQAQLSKMPPMPPTPADVGF